MIIFRTVRKNLNAIGFGPNDSNPNEYHVRVILLSISVGASVFVYIWNEVDTAEGYMRCFFMMIVGIAISISYFTTIAQKIELYDMIETFQQIIMESK